MNIDLANEQDLEELKVFLKENLLSKNEAMVITDQTSTAFNQAVTGRQIQPFFETEGKGPAKVKLYLKSELEEYARTKRQINKK